MTPTECVKLCKFIAARCPAMRMQDETPDAWYVDLRDFDFTVAVEAARRTTLDQTFIGIGDLVRGCEAIIRREAGVRRLAELDAQVTAENPPDEITERPVASLTVGRTVPVDDEVRAERRRMLQKAAHTKREQTEQESASRQAYHDGMQQARAELETLRASQAQATPDAAVEREAVERSSL